MSARARCKRALLVVVACGLWVSAQNPTINESVERVVSIPVTVTDVKGVPVSGVPAANFSLIEGGQSRRLASVDEIGPLTAGVNKKKVTFIVFDGLGTPLQVQTEHRKKLLQFMADAVASGSPIALSEIDRDGLRVVHDLSIPMAVLASALLKLDGEKRLLGSPEKLKAVAAEGHDEHLISAEVDQLRRFRDGNLHSLNMMRTFLTQLSSFRALANALRGAAGRKTAIWFTGYFPIEINDAEHSINIDSYSVSSGFPVKSASVDYQQTLDLLNKANVTVFTVQMAGAQRTVIGLDLFARSTGGELLRDANNIEALVKRAEDQTGTYYLLKFQPEHIRSGVKWTKLRVHVEGQSYKARAPDGLFVFAVTK